MTVVAMVMNATAAGTEKTGASTTKRLIVADSAEEFDRFCRLCVNGCAKKKEVEEEEKEDGRREEKE